MYIVYNVKEQIDDIKQRYGKYKKESKEMPEIRNTIAEMETISDRLIGRLDWDWESLSELEDRSIETSHTEIQTDNEDNPEQNTQELCYNFRRWNIHVIRTSEVEKRENGTKEIFEVIMTDNFLELMTDTSSQIQEAQKTPSSVNARNL